MSALFQSFTTLSLSSRGARGDSRVASPSTRAMPTPQKRTAVVTEAVRFLVGVAPFFCLSPPSFFVYKAERVCSNRDAGPPPPAHAKARWTRRRWFFAEDDVLNSILDDARWFASTGGRFCPQNAPRAGKDETKTNFIRERRLLQVFKEARKPSLFW